MATIELPIKSTYVSEWGLWEGIREIVQNAKDEEDENGSPMSIEFSSRSDELRIKNQFASMNKAVLLLGESSKTDNQKLRGKFGEGLNLAMLALIRAGYEMEVRTNDEIWRPFLTHSEEYDREVLAVKSTQRRKDWSFVEVIIKDITEGEWKSCKEKILFLADEEPEGIEVNGTKILTGDEYSGEIFVKGIYVGHHELHLGYDLRDADIDRDRRMINEYDLKWDLASVYDELLRKDEDHLDLVYELVMSEAPDVSKIGSSWSSRRAKEKIRERFKEKHEDKIPVTSTSQSRELAHFGVDTAVVSDTVHEVVSDGREFEEVKESYRRQTKTRYAWAELEESEQAAFSFALDVLESIDENFDARNVSIATFAVGTRGFYEDGEIFLSRSLLDDKVETLRVLIHEHAHREGEDSEKEHVQEIERLWTSAYRRLLVDCS